MTLYLIRAKCPYCRRVSSLVEERDAPIQLTQDVEIRSTHHCPQCGNHMVGIEWDVHEESEIERVEPSEGSG